MDLLIPLIIRLTIVLGLGWIVLLLIRKSNPRWTILVSRGVLCAAVAVPLIAWMGPTWRVPLLPQRATNTPTAGSSSTGSPELAQLEHTERFSEQPQSAVDENGVSPGSALAEVEELAATDSVFEPNPESAVAVAAQPETPNEQFDQRSTASESTATRRSHQSTQKFHRIIFRTFLTIWLLVTIGLLVRLLTQAKQTLRLLKTAVAASDRIRSIAERVTISLGVAPGNNLPIVRTANNLTGPCSAGWLKPVILLPQSWAETATDADLRTVIAHECSHVTGRDALWDFLAQTIRAVCWFHPLAWFLPRLHRLACEHRADSAAASVGGGLACYRRSLAAWALEFNQGVVPHAPSAFSMADRSLLHQRLAWLKTFCNARQLGRKKILATVACGTLICAVIASVTIVRAQPITAGTQNSDPPNAKVQNEADAVRLNGQPPGEKAATKDFTVRIVDESGDPISIAEVAMGNWEAADEALHLVPIEYRKVGSDGKITLKFPVAAVTGYVSVRAKGFANASARFTLSATATIKLKRGRIIRVRATDETGTLYDDAMPLLENSRMWGQEFKLDKDGILTSPAVNMDRRFMRVVGVSDEDMLLFSDLIDVTSDKAAADDGIIHTTLKPGVRLRGVLDDSVPRPVKNGVVELCITEADGHRISTADNYSERFKRNCFVWQESVAVQEDGSFEFSSLPAGGHVQLFVLVDGFQSALPSFDELAAYIKKNNTGGVGELELAMNRRYSIHPRLFPLHDDDDDGTVNVTVPCMPVTDLQVKVVSPSGEPIIGAEVKLNPNGLFLGGGLFIPGTEMNMAYQARGKSFFARDKKISDWVNQTLTSVPTDENGVAKVNLPGRGTETFQVAADGFVLPIHPLSSADSPRRYSSVELNPGRTLRRTITMERAIDVIEREVLVVNNFGQPLPKIALTAIEVAFSETPEDWEAWSVQRFGPIVRGESSKQGKVLLRLPKRIDGKPVQRYRVDVQGVIDRKKKHGFRNKEGGLTRDAYVRTKLIIPVKDDGHVIAISNSKVAPADKRRAYWDASAEYVDPIHLTPASGEQLLKNLVEQPSLVLLKQLLSINDYRDSVPLEFKADFNYLSEGRARKPVAVVPCDDENRVLVICKVRPAGSVWNTKPEGRFPPVAAFVFREHDGKLITTIGGGQSESGSYDNVTVMNLGGGDDSFIWVSRFEKRDVNAQGSRWYRVSRAELGPSLSMHHDANGNPFMAMPGPSEPLAEFGYLEYVAKGRRVENWKPGVAVSGVPVSRQLYWDVARNRFYGPAQQSVNGLSMYRIVPEDSPEFTAIEPVADEIQVGGGRFGHDSAKLFVWHVVIPAKQKGQLILKSKTSTADAQTVEKLIHEIKLKAGVHSVEFSIDRKKKPEEEVSENESLLFLAATGEEGVVKQESKVVRIPPDKARSVPDKPVMRTGQGSVLLWKRAVIDADGETTTFELTVVSEP